MPDVLTSSRAPLRGGLRPALTGCRLSRCARPAGSLSPPGILGAMEDRLVGGVRGVERRRERTISGRVPSLSPGRSHSVCAKRWRGLRATSLRQAEKGIARLRVVVVYEAARHRRR